MMKQKVFLAEVDSLYEMLDFIKNYGQSQGVPSSVLNQIILATEEALVNIINYAYSEGKKKGTIEIVCEDLKLKKGIKITVKDQGIPFNPIENAPSIPSPSAILDKAEKTLGGYGIHLLLKLMDKVEYQRINEENVLSLSKYL